MIARALLCCALAVGVAVPTALAMAAEPRGSLPDIEDEVMCPICGTTLELSEAPQAERERELIRGLIAQGKTKDEIKDALIAQYGREVLATPEGSGFDLTAWLVPAIGIPAAAIALLLGLRRIRAREQTGDLAPKLSAEEQERVEADISAFDRWGGGRGS